MKNIFQELENCLSIVIPIFINKGNHLEGIFHTISKKYIIKKVEGKLHYKFKKLLWWPSNFFKKNWSPLQLPKHFYGKLKASLKVFIAFSIFKRDFKVFSNLQNFFDEFLISSKYFQIMHIFQKIKNQTLIAKSSKFCCLRLLRKHLVRIV